jgi:hypothetical protein
LAPKSIDLINLLAEVEKLITLVEVCDRWHVQTWAKVNAFGARLDKIEAMIREDLK